MVSFGKGQKFDLIRTPYGRRGSGLFVFEDYELPIIRMSNFKVDSSMSGGDFIFDIRLLQRDRTVRYSYFADAGSLKMTQYGEAGGWAEIALTDREHLRIRGNCTLRIELRSAHEGNAANACQGVFDFLDGSGTEAYFGKYGKMFFKALEGSLKVTAEYDAQLAKYKSFCVEITPDCNTDGYDVAIHEYHNREFSYDGTYENFDMLIADNKTDFESFKNNYTKVAEGYEETAEYAMWLIWSHRVNPGGFYKVPMILMHLQWLNACASWQQSYNAMPMLGNVQEAWRMICSLFEHQDETTGRLPGMMFYSGGAGVQAPFQGFALDFILQKHGDDFLTPEECRRMYPKFEKWINYWLTYRDAKRGNDLIHIRTAHDSGWDDSSMFKDGFPVTPPDIVSFLIVLMECTARLAKGAGADSAAASWQERSEKLLNILVTEMWDGEKFAAIKADGTKVDSMSLANYQPIMLGKRLPQHIIDKVAEILTVEDHYLSPIGLCTESMRSPLCSWVNQFVLGRVVAPANMILTVGLHLAGKTEEASMIAQRFCNKVKEEGMILGFAPYDRYPLNGEKVDFNVPPMASDPWPWSTWTANSFLTMAANIVKK